MVDKKKGAAKKRPAIKSPPTYIIYIVYIDTPDNITYVFLHFLYIDTTKNSNGIINNIGSHKQDLKI